MQKNKNTQEYFKEITTDLYYDLLEKYVQLKASYNKVKQENIKLRLENKTCKN